MNIPIIPGSYWREESSGLEVEVLFVSLFVVYRHLTGDGEEGVDIVRTFLTDFNILTPKELSHDKASNS